MEAFSIVAVVSLLGCAVALPTPCLPVAPPPCSTSNTGYSFFFSIYQSSYSYSYFDADMCISVPGCETISKYIPTYVYEDIDKMMLEMKCKYLSSYSMHYPTDIGPTICNLSEDQLMFDYVVLSSGPAALSALEALVAQGYSIAVVEEGLYPSSVSNSLYYRGAMLNSQYVKPYSAYIGPRGCETTKKMYVPNCLGGESLYDTNAWNTGYSGFYEKMAKLNKVFSWDNAQSKYQKFQRHEKTTTTTTTEKSVQVGASGCVSTINKFRQITTTNCISSVFSELGYGNDFTPLGADYAPGLSIIPSISSNNGRKCLSFPQEMFSKLTCFDNIKLIMGQRVQRLIYECGRIAGVEIITENGTTVCIRARYDVILGSSSIPMFELLTRSGIGNSVYLNKLGIDVVADLPCLGKNLIVNPMCANAVIRFPRGTLVEDDNFDVSGLSFMYGGNSLSELDELSYLSAFISVAQSTVSNVKLQFYVFTSSMSTYTQITLCNLFQLDHETVEFVLKTCQSYDLLLVVPQLLSPSSTGCMEYGDTIDDLRINLGMLQDELDIQAMIEALQFIRKLATTSAVLNMGGEFMNLPVNSIQITGDFYSPENIPKWLHQTCAPSLHISGGAIMGTQIENSVVDSDFSFYGLPNLLCFGTAVVPYPMYSNSIAIGSLIGAYGSDTILKRHETGYYETLAASSSSSTLISNNGIGNTVDTRSYISDTEFTDIGSSTYSTSGISNIGTIPGVDNCGSIPIGDNCGSIPIEDTCNSIPIVDTCDSIPIVDNCGSIPSVETCGLDTDLLSTSYGSSLNAIDIDMASSNAQSSSLLSNGVSNSFSESQSEALSYSSDVITSNNGIRSIQNQDTTYAAAEYENESTAVLGNGCATISEYEAAEAEAYSSSSQTLSSGMGGVQSVSQSTNYAAAEYEAASTTISGNGCATISEYEATETEASSSSFQAVSSGVGCI